MGRSHGSSVKHWRITALLHTIALNSNEINADVRKKLMKMAKIGGGGLISVERLRHSISKWTNS